MVEGIMKLKRGFVVKDVAGKKYAVATGEVARSFKGMLKLNEMGTIVFTLLQQSTTEEEIVQAIMQEYDAPHDLVMSDVKNFIYQLRSINVLEDL